MMGLLNSHTIFSLWGLTTLIRHWPVSWPGQRVDVSFWLTVSLHSLKLPRDVSQANRTVSSRLDRFELSVNTFSLRTILKAPWTFSPVRISPGPVLLHFRNSGSFLVVLVFYLFVCFLFTDSFICLTHKSPLAGWTVVACVGVVMRLWCGKFAKTCDWNGRDCWAMWIMLASMENGLKRSLKWGMSCARKCIGVQTNTKQRKITLSNVEIPFSLQIQLQKPSFALRGVFQGNTLRYNHNVTLINDFLIIFNEASSTDPGKAFWSHSTQCSEGPRLKLMIHSHHLVIHIYI